MQCRQEESFYLDESISEEALLFLVQNGLDKEVSGPWSALQSQRRSAEQQIQADEQGTLKMLEDEIQAENNLLVSTLAWEAAGTVVEKFS